MCGSSLCEYRSLQDSSIRPCREWAPFIPLFHTAGPVFCGWSHSTSSQDSSGDTSSDGRTIASINKRVFFIVHKNARSSVCFYVFLSERAGLDATPDIFEFRIEKIEIVERQKLEWCYFMRTKKMMQVVPGI